MTDGEAELRGQFRTTANQAEYPPESVDALVDDIIAGLKAEGEL